MKVIHHIEILFQDGSVAYLCQYSTADEAVTTPSRDWAIEYHDLSEAQEDCDKLTEMGYNASVETSKKVVHGND